MSDDKNNYGFTLLPIDPSAQDSTTADNYDGLLAQLGIDQEDSAFQIKVYEVGAHGNYPWLFDVSQDDELPLLQRLRDDHGSGQYEVRVLSDGKIRKRHKVSVKAPKPKPQPPQPQTAATDVLAVMQRMQEQTIATVQGIVDRMQTQQPQPDPAAQRREFFQELGTLKELFQPPSPPKQQDQFAMFRDFLEFQRELGIGQGGGDDSMMGLISSVARDVIGPLAKAAQAHQGNAAARPRLGNAPPKSQTHYPESPAPGPWNKDNLPPAKPDQATKGSSHEPVNNTPAPQPAPPPEPDMNELQRGLSQLCAFAMVRVTPAGAAQSLHDNASDEQYNMLAEIIEHDDCIDRLIELYEPVARHREWFQLLRAELQQLYAIDAADEGDDPDDQLTGEDQQAIHPAGDGAASHKDGNAADNEVAATGDPGEDTVR